MQMLWKLPPPSPDFAWIRLKDDRRTIYQQVVELYQKGLRRVERIWTGTRVVRAKRKGHVKMFGITKRGSIQGIVPVIEYMSMCCPGFSEHLY